MTGQIKWEDVQEKQELPHVIKKPSTKQLVKFAGVSSEFSQIHYDKDYAQNAGLPGVIVHGWLSFSFIAQVLTNWIGEHGIIKKIGINYRGMFFPGEDITCKAFITKKYIEGTDHRIDLEIWAENPNGEKNAIGNATIVLPTDLE